MKRRLLPLLCCFFLCAVSPPYAAMAADTVKTIRVSAPAVPQSIALLRLPESSSFRETGMKVVFTPCRSPEQMHIFVANREVDAIIATLPTAAVFSGKGIPCKVLAVYSAPLWLVSTAPPMPDTPGVSPLDSFMALQGREILLPFGPGNMPELVLQVLAAKSGVNFTMRHCGSSMEAANLLLRGQAAYALLPEPAATLAASQKLQTQHISKQLVLKDVWPRVFPGQPSMPTAALIMVGPLADDPTTCALLRQNFMEGVSWAESHPEAALRLAETKYPELGRMLYAAPTLGQEVFRSLGLLSEQEGKRAARFMLERLFAISPASVGGKLPGDDIWEVDDAAQ